MPALVAGWPRLTYVAVFAIAMSQLACAPRRRTRFSGHPAPRLDQDQNSEEHTMPAVRTVNAVAVPGLIADDVNAATREVLVNCSFVVIIIAVIPWRYVWGRYVGAPGDAWR